MIESHGETTQGPIANGAVPATFTVTGIEPGFGMRIIGEEVDDTLGFLDVELLNVLNLKVDTTTGEAVLENPVAGGLPLDVDAYTITSPPARSTRPGSTDWPTTARQAGYLVKVPARDRADSARRILTPQRRLTAHRPLASATSSAERKIWPSSSP